MPNWSSDDDSGCTRGDSIGFALDDCKCGACTDSRARAAQSEAQSDAYYRRIGLDPNANVEIIGMVAVTDETFLHLTKSARKRGCTVEQLAQLILENAVRTAKRRGF